MSKLPDDFDWNIYTSINNDLKGFNEEEAKTHYLRHGFSENRIYKMINLHNKNVVLITSKIYVSNKKFSYTSNRSIYTIEERFNQTLETIHSIKKNITNTYIILFDNSFFANKDYYNMLNNNVDKFINITNNNTLNFYTDIYQYKAFSDVSQQLSFYNTFFKYVDMNSFNKFFKISGRYLVNHRFNFNNYNNNANIFKKNNDVTDRDYYYTCFYKLNSKIIHLYFEQLKQLIDNKHLYENTYSDLEVILPKFLINTNAISLTDTLGITQRIAVNNTIEDI